jgi:hypothetical protein
MSEVHSPSLEGIVVADATAATLIARYAEAKRQDEDAKNRADSLRNTIMTTMDALGARKFSDDLGEILIARTEVTTPEAVDIARLKTRHPVAYADTVKPRSKFYRLNLPRLSRR